MLFIMGYGVREAPASGRCGFEALITPTAVQIEIAQQSPANEGTPVGRHVLDAAPVAQQSQPGDRGDECNRTFCRGLNLGKLAALSVAVETVDMTAEHQATLVGLRNIEQLRAVR